MSKRIIAAALILCLLLPSAPTAGAWAEDIGLNKLSVLAWQREYRVLEVYQCGDDLLMSAEDLSWLTNFSYTQSGNVFAFTRGSKTVKVDTEQQLIYMEGNTHGLYLQSACRSINGMYYLSAASILPWLNTHCSVKDGILVAVPNAVSLWDVMDTFDPLDYMFTVEQTAESILSSTGSGGRTFFSKGFGLIYYFAGDGKNSNMGEELDYYELFGDMIQDVSATDKGISNWIERYDMVDKTIGFVGTGVSYLDETMGEAMDQPWIGYSKEALSLLTYCAMFRQDGENKVDILHTLVNGADASSNSGMVSAAVNVIADYTDFWKGIFNKITYQVVTGLPDSASSGTVLSMLGYGTKVAHPSHKQVARINLYNNLINEAMDGYRCYTGETTLIQLKDYVNYIILYLYATEQNCRAMADYLEDNHSIHPPEYWAYLEKAEKAEAAQAQFVNISLLLEDDCSDVGIKRTATEEYLKLFRQIDPNIVPGGITAAAEMGIYWAALADMNVPVYQWDVADLDQDGENELLVMGDDGVNHWPCYIALDPNNFAIGTYENSDFFTYLYLRKTVDGRYGIQKDDADGVLSDTIQVWNGRAYEAAPAAGVQAASLPSKDLTEQIVTGNTTDLLKRLDSYFGRRPHSRRYTADLNGDGREDRVYVIPKAADLWTDLCRDTYYGACNALYYQDDKITVLVAEPQNNGVKLRVARVEYPGFAEDVQVDLASGTVIAGDRIYTYQSTGVPFVSGINTYGFSAADLLGLSPDQIRQVLDSYREYDGSEKGTAQGVYQSVYLALTFTEYYGASAEDSVLADLSFSAMTGERICIVDDLYTGDTVLDFLNAPSLADVSDISSTGMYYEVSGTYRDKAGNAYQLTAGFNGNTVNATLIYVIFIRIS